MADEPLWRTIPAYSIEALQDLEQDCLEYLC